MLVHVCKSRIIISHSNIIILHVICCSVHLWRQICQILKLVSKCTPIERWSSPKIGKVQDNIMVHYKTFQKLTDALIFTGKFCREDQGTILSKLKVYQWNAQQSDFNNQFERDFINVFNLMRFCQNTFVHRVNYYYTAFLWGFKLEFNRHH